MNKSAQPIGVQHVATLFLVTALGFNDGLSVARAAMDKSDATFVTRAAAAGILEVQASQTAITCTDSPDVRAFAQRMVKDRITVGGELKTLAGKKGIMVPGSLPAGERTKMDRLNALKGAKFDKTYADEVGMKTHKEAISLSDKASKDVKNPDIKVFFAYNLPALREHLQMAKQLKTATKQFHGLNPSLIKVTINGRHLSDRWLRDRCPTKRP